MALVMSTLFLLLCMALIVTMAMESEEIAQFIRSPIFSGGNMVDFYQIALLKEQFTPATLSLLFVQQSSQFTHSERMRLA